MTETFTTKSGRVLGDEDFEALADEAERGYDLADADPVLPTLWIAELLSEAGHVRARIVLTNRKDAEDALSARWRVARYVRADLGQQTP